jgi:hypothetical protein
MDSAFPPNFLTAKGKKKEVDSLLHNRPLLLEMNRVTELVRDRHREAELSKGCPQLIGRERDRDTAAY